MLFCIGSCQLPNGVSIGPADGTGKETITMNFSKVDLKFNLSKKINTGFISGDYEELVSVHAITNPDWTTYSGSINNLGTILANADNYDEDHKPSISVTIEDLFSEKTVHNCNKEDVSWNTVFGIPNISKFYQATVTIKSIKTRDNGVQVVWTKSAFQDNWPINEFVKDGSVTCENTAIIKVGTNNDSGDVATRNNTIISNTSNQATNKDVLYAIEANQIISPNLVKPVLVGGKSSKDVKWSEPIIYKAL